MKSSEMLEKIQKVHVAITDAYEKNIKLKSNLESLKPKFSETSVFSFLTDAGKNVQNHRQKKIDIAIQIEENEATIRELTSNKREMLKLYQQALCVEKSEESRGCYVELEKLQPEIKKAEKNLRDILEKRRSLAAQVNSCIAFSSRGVCFTDPCGTLEEVRQEFNSPLCPLTLVDLEKIETEYRKREEYTRSQDILFQGKIRIRISNDGNIADYDIF